MSRRNGNQEISFTFFGLSLRVRSTVPEFTRNLERIFFPFRGSSTAGRSLASYRVTGKDPFRLSRGGRVIYRSERLDYLVEYLETDLLSLLIQRLEGHLLVHAGAATLGRDTVLLPGASGAGKTTLVAALVREGFAYVTDEMAVFDAEDSRLLPFPKALNLKAPSVGLFRPFGPDLELLVPEAPIRGDRVHHLLVRRERVLPPGRFLRVTRIVFPRYGGRETARLEPVTRATAIGEIAQLSFNHHRLQDSVLGCLENLVRPADCHRLFYSDLEPAVGLIRGLFHGSPARAAVIG